MNIGSMLVNKWLLCFFAYTLEALEATGKADVEHFFLALWESLSAQILQRSCRRTSQNVQSKTLWPTEFEWSTVNMNILNRFW